MRQLSDVEDQVRSRKIAVKDYEAAREEIKAIEPLHLTLPFELPDTELQIISNKLRQDYGPRFLIETKIDPALLGGCTMSYKGVYKDYSIKNKLKQTIDDRR